jgi:hypothetical protein
VWAVFASDAARPRSTAEGILFFLRVTAHVIGFSAISCLKAPDRRKIIAAKLSASAPGRLSSELERPFHQTANPAPR